MANKTFNFTNIKKSFFTVTLKNGTTLPVKMPKKRTFEKIVAIQELDEDTTINQTMDSFAAICAEILSHNMKEEVVTTEYIVENYDIEEMTKLIESYMDFVGSIQSNPN